MSTLAPAEPDWIRPQWPAPARVAALITTRSGGVSTGSYASLNLGAHVGDRPEDVARNRARLRASLPAEPCYLDQVHGTEVIDLDQRPGMAGDGVRLRADAACARSAEVICTVLSADCLPVLLCDGSGSVVAAAHAGWRGLCAGVIENAVRAMQVPPTEVLAYLGPAIGAQHYEVGDEVRRVFLSADPDSADAFRPSPAGRWLADLSALARRRLRHCGVAAVYGGDYCTYREAQRFFSFRRDGVTGRMAAMIWLR